jgi:hypothetical protein
MVEKIEYIEEVEYVDGFKIINRTPIYSLEQENKVIQNILQGLNRLYNDRMSIDTKVKHIYNDNNL